MPHLIVLDYNIPDMNGLDIMRYLRSNDLYKDIPVVFWSTSTSPILKQTCEQEGARLFITKPATVDGMLDMTKRMLMQCDGVKSGIESC